MNLLNENIGFTGTQKGMSREQRRTVQALLEEALNRGFRVFRHGICEGADEQAHKIAFDLGYVIVGHPGVDSRGRSPKRADIPAGQFHEIFPEQPYLVRNKVIVRESIWVIATPETADEKERGSGTWATIRNARQRKRSLAIVSPTGGLISAHTIGKEKA